MFGFLKNLISKLDDTPVDYQEPPLAEAAPAEMTPEAATPSLRDSRKNFVYQDGQHRNGHGIELPLQKILTDLPLELQPRVRQTDVGELTISIPLEKILAQLSRGTVRIPFGELRQAAPEVFSEEADRDRVLVTLPLAEILLRLNPALITRRRVQRKVEVPEDICSPFDAHGQGLVFTVGPAKPEPAPTQPPRHAMPAPPPRYIAPASPLRHISPAMPTPVAPSRGSITFAHPLPPPAARPLATPAPEPAAPAMMPALRVMREVSTSQSHAVPECTPQPAKPTSGPEPLIIGLTSLAEGWPEAVRREIVEVNLVDAKVALPSDAVEQALKLGRIAFSWKTLRSWIRPLSLERGSAYDGTVLELPLKVVAPLFLTRQREANRSQQKVAIDEDIPNLFFGFPQGEAGGSAVATPASAAVTKPADTNYYVWDDASDVVREREPETRHPSVGTKFVAKYATPNEIVSRAASLDGVAGALIALPDGLMVANKLPSDVNADTLAAFLPQIFGKVSQCTKELRMGELNNLNFTVGNVPWKIFRVNAIFFAAFGRTAEPLPTGQLAALAAELDHKPK